MTTVPDLSTAFGLGAAQGDALARYVDLLLGWRRANVTAVRTHQEAVDRLLGDSLALLDVPALEDAGERWLDLGSGSGIPGIPLAVARSRARLTLLDSVRKKCAFLEAAVEATGLDRRAAVVCARSETFAAPQGGGREAFDVVFVRAVAGLATVVELAAPLLCDEGLLLAVKAAGGAAGEGPAGDAAAARCGLSPGTVTPLPRSPLESSVCVVYRKLAPAPDWLPRRPGLAARRPLAS